MLLGVTRADVKLGFACNNRCVFCAQGRKRERASALSRKEISEALNEGRPGSDRLVLTGGEPTIRRDLVEIVSEARSIGYRSVQIQTNGRMFAYRAACEALIGAGATEFSPALHGDTAELHDALVGCRGAFNQTVAGIRNLVELGAPVLANTVVVRANLRQLSVIAQVLCDLGVTQYQLAYVHPVGTAAERFQEVVPRPRELLPHVHEALDVGRRRHVHCFTEAVPLCLLRGYEWAAAEARMPHTVVFDLGVTVDFQAYRLNEGKAKGPPCTGCTWRDRCEGPWREIPQKFGWDDFQARAD